MTKKLDVFLPPEEEKTPQPVKAQASPMRLWLITLIVGGLLKIYQCMPVSLNIGSPVVAEENESQQISERQEETSHPENDNTNPMLINMNEMQILQQLKKRRIDIEKQSKEQEDRRQEMEILNEVIKKNIIELNEVKASLDAQAQSLQKEPQEALQKMAKLYEGMKPAQAAKILEDMETIIVAKIIALIKKQVASGIMATLSDKKARAVTLQTLQMKQEKKQ